MNHDNRSRAAGALAWMMLTGAAVVPVTSYAQPRGAQDEAEAAPVEAEEEVAVDGSGEAAPQELRRRREADAKRRATPDREMSMKR